MDSNGMLRVLRFVNVIQGMELGVRITDDNLLYATDLGMIVTGNNLPTTKASIYRMSQHQFPSNKYILRTLGAGSPVRLVTLTDSVQFIMSVPGRTSKLIRTRFANVVHRFIAGEANLIKNMPCVVYANDLSARGFRAAQEVDLEGRLVKRKASDMEPIFVDDEEVSSGITARDVVMVQNDRAATEKLLGPAAALLAPAEGPALSCAAGPSSSPAGAGPSSSFAGAGPSSVPTEEPVSPTAALLIPTSSSVPEDARVSPFANLVGPDFTGNVLRTRNISQHVAVDVAKKAEGGVNIKPVPGRTYNLGAGSAAGVYPVVQPTLADLVKPAKPDSAGPAGSAQSSPAKAGSAQSSPAKAGPAEPSPAKAGPAQPNPAPASSTEPRPAKQARPIPGVPIPGATPVVLSDPVSGKAIMNALPFRDPNSGELIYRMVICRDAANKPVCNKVLMDRDSCQVFNVVAGCKQLILKANADASQAKDRVLKLTEELLAANAQLVKAKDEVIKAKDEVVAVKDSVAKLLMEKLEAFAKK